MEIGVKNEDVTISDGLLGGIEREFNEAMEALSDEADLGRFRLEYDKMYRALKKSHESEKQLVSTCRGLTHDLLNNAAKMQAAVKLSQGDHVTIEALKKEIEKAWRTVDSATDKDLRARETIKSLSQEIASLQALTEEGSAVSSDHISTLEELKLERKRLQAEVDEMTKDVETYSKEISEMTIQQKKLEEDSHTNAEEVSRISDRFEMVRQELRRERNACERADIQCRELLLGLKAREDSRDSKQIVQARLEASVAALQDNIQKNNEKRQALLQKLETADRQLFHTKQSYNDSVDTTTDLNERLHDIDRQIVEAERHQVELRAETDRIHRVKDSDFKELLRLRQQNDTIRQAHENMKRQQTLLQKRIESIQKEKGSLVEAIQVLKHEHDLLEKRGTREVEKKQAVERYLQIKKDNFRELEECIAREQEISVHLKGEAERLEKDREKCVTEISQVNLQQKGAHEELKAATASVEATQRRIEERVAKLNLQQATYESVRTERNQFSKKLIEAQDEIVELNLRFKMMDHQIQQFKEELKMKEKKYHDEISRQKTSKERLTKAIKQVNEHTAAFDEAKMKSETIGRQIKQLVKGIHICDKELSAQQQHFLAISNERDLLGTQLIRRNDELALLYEKMRIQQETLGRGEVAYRERMEDVRVLRLKMSDLTRQSNLAHTRSRMLDGMKEKLRVVENELCTEQSKVAVLSEELENPQNTMRWRKIDGRDPTPEELEKKITALQRRLILRSEESLEKELLLQEKERLQVELQTILARQPGPQVAQQLNAYHRELQRKNARMKQKASELNMTSTHISELKYEAERLRRELHDMKRKYYDMKMRCDQLEHQTVFSSPRCVNGNNVPN